MRNTLFILAFCLAGMQARSQVTNQYAFTAAGGSGQAGGYIFEFSLGDVFTQTGISPLVVNTPGIIQPAGAGSALPVKLVSFQVSREGSTAQLLWSTSSEENSDRFEIERSANGKSWQMIGTVAAAGEARNTLTHYHFSDSLPLSGANYYRLKMTDTDGTFAYSQIRNMYFGVSLSLYPNPVSERLFIQTGGNDKVTSVSICDMAGQNIMSFDGAATSGILVSQLSSGLYMVKISLSDHQIITRKIAIRR